MTVVALDVGGTAVKSALVGEDGHLASAIERTPVDSLGPAGALLDALAAIARRLVPGADGLAIAFPGPCDYARGVPGRHADGKFAALAGLDLRAELRDRLDDPGLEIGFCNDAEAAIAAEALCGAGRPFARVLGITLGAGLGACLVAHRGVIVERCGTTVPGDLYREPCGDATADDVFSDRGLRARLARAGVRSPDPATARGRAARGAFAAFGAELGRFLAPRIGALRADALVVAGGIAAAAELFEAPLQAAVPVPARAGELSRAAGLLGAAAMLRGRVGRAVEDEPERARTLR